MDCEDRQSREWIFIGGAALLVLALWAGAGYTIYSSFDKWDERGQFGDLFGAVNALFSGLAFLGVIVAIFLQRKELTLQRQELKLQREEMRGSREALTTQAILQRHQLRASITELRIRAIEATVAAIETESHSIHDPVRFGKAIRDVAETMNRQIDELEKAIGGAENH